MERIRVLYIEDNPGDARLIGDMLADVPNVEFALDWRQTLSEGLKSLAENKYDIVLLDLGLPDSPQRSVTFTRVQTTAPTVPIIVLTGLDDETFAVTTVARGAQDYLVKGKVDSATVVRTVRYAIARKHGGDRLFAATDLAQYDGSQGRPVYIAFKGMVYDASGSGRWKNGKHGAGQHQAGKDMTEAIARAPHGEEMLARLAIVGSLQKKETYQGRLIRMVDSLHPHNTFVHVTFACVAMAPFTFSLWILLNRPVWDEVTLSLLVMGAVSLPLSILTGLIGWIVSYESKATRVFNVKIATGILLFVVTVGTMVWRLTGQEMVLVRPGSYLYLALLFVQFALVLLLDYYGKKTVYA
jgi:predicted heme/steroid binding protein/uncharacterized membrane protein/ActR/RegA family two-component response regulator